MDLSTCAIVARPLAIYLFQIAKHERREALHLLPAQISQAFPCRLWRCYKQREKRSDRIVRALRVLSVSVAPRLKQFSQNIITLHLVGCGIGDCGAVHLSVALTSDSTVTHLFLEQNGISDRGAVALSSMLKQNRTLKFLILDKNRFGTKGQRALRDAIYDDSSFTNMKQSNHVLSSYFDINHLGVFGRPMLSDVLFSHAANVRSRSSESVRTKKMVRMVRKRYNIELCLHSLEDVVANCVPNLFGWLGGMCDVDMMYSFMPMLFRHLETRIGAGVGKM